MITIRKSKERGYADHGWLQSFHTFSFAGYFDPRFMGFRSLRVINEDRVAPGQGFGTHGHRDMEIITYVVSGTLAHKDSMGHVAPIHAGEVQYMSAGSGVRHSEFNHSQEAPVQLLQIWIEPNVEGAPPRYSQMTVSRQEKLGQLRLLAAAESAPGTIEIRQDAKLFATVLDGGQQVGYEIKSGRHAWVQVVAGKLAVNGHDLESGDGAAVSDETKLVFTSALGAEFLLFDLA